MLSVICFLFVLCFRSVSSFKDGCETVKKGNFYHEHHGIPGVVDKKVYGALVYFHKDMSRYLFPPTYEKGVYCSHSWNKLFGKSRCGHLHHIDSDRFVWRRSFECLLTNGSFIIGENLTCPWIDYLDIAAYSYVDGEKPFQHQGTLLKEFKTKLEVESWHYIELTDFGNYTSYKLVPNIKSTNNIINELKINNNNYDKIRKKKRIISFDKEEEEEEEEILIVNTRECTLGTIGYDLDLYFGGECPAPQDVTCCYKHKN